MAMNDYTGRAQAAAPGHATAVCALLAGALVWGLAWYPFRALRDAGIGGELASTITYLVALAIGAIAYRKQLGGMRPDAMLLAIALASGACNVGFVLATIYGSVARAVLLFYLAPAWTVVFAYLLLGERLSAAGFRLSLLALAGALVMLWNEELGMPWPGNVWEWIALGSGVLFALANVLVRKAQDHTIERKSLFVFAGCAATALCATLLAPAGPPLLASMSLNSTLLLLLIGIVLWAVNYAVQFGLGRVPANQAIVIYLSELLFAAGSSWLLAGETLDVKECTGGLMIVAASLLSGRLRPPSAMPPVGAVAPPDRARVRL